MPLPREMMEQAWALRRRLLDLPSSERSAGLNEVKGQIEKAACLCRDSGSLVELAHATHLLAHVELDLGERERARKLWENAVEILRTTDNAAHLAHKVRHLGDILAELGRLSEADSCYSEALDLCRTTPQVGGGDYANALRRAALLKERLGRIDEAREMWRLAGVEYAAVGLEAGTAEAELSIARLDRS